MIESIPDEGKAQLYNAGSVLMTLERAHPVDLTAEDLERYCGVYESEELAVRFEITIEGQELMLRRTTPERTRLRSAGPDEFAASFGRIRFDGTGFVADTSRATGVRFEKT